MSSPISKHLSKDQVRIERRVPDEEDFRYATEYRLLIPQDVGKALSEAAYAELFAAPDFRVVTSQFAVSRYSDRPVFPSPWSEYEEGSWRSVAFDTQEGESVHIFHSDTEEGLDKVTITLREYSGSGLDYTAPPTADESDWVEVKGLLEFVFSVLD